MSVDTSFHHITAVEVKEENKDGYVYVSVRLHTAENKSIYWPSYQINIFGVDDDVKVTYIKD
tara:strand:- start:429 stop:614 length:186 start_codon:yes stop_codon:yes gene_type:complete